MSAAIVAGGAGAIGRAITERLIAQDVKVAVFDSDEAALAAITHTHGTDSCVPCPVDLSSATAVEAAVASVVESLGTPELLVSSVGMLGPHEPMAWELGEDDWARVIAVNLFGPVNLVRAALPHLESAGEPARIAVITSLFGFIPDARLTAYAAAKHALVSYAETLRAQLGARGLPIDVTIIGPGGVATGMNLAFRDANNLSVPPDWLTPDEVAAQVVDAADRRATYAFTHEGSREKLSVYFDQLRSGATR